MSAVRTTPKPPGAGAPLVAVPAPPRPPVATTWRVLTPAGTVKTCSPPVLVKVTVSAIAALGAASTMTDTIMAKWVARRVGRGREWFIAPAATAPVEAARAPGSWSWLGGLCARRRLLPGRQRNGCPIRYPRPASLRSAGRAGHSCRARRRSSAGTRPRYGHVREANAGSSRIRPAHLDGVLGRVVRRDQVGGCAGHRRRVAELRRERAHASSVTPDRSAHVVGLRRRQRSCHSCGGFAHNFLPVVGYMTAHLLRT